MDIINVKLVGKTFFFLTDIHLNKADAPVTISLTDRSDNVKASLTIAIANGVITSDTTAQLVLDTIVEYRRAQQVADQLGLINSVPAPTGVFASTETVQAQVVSMETESDAGVSTLQVEAPEYEEESGELEVPKDERSLDTLLEGSARAASNKIKKAHLTDAEKGELYAIEEDGLNRSAVKKVLEV